MLKIIVVCCLLVLFVAYIILILRRPKFTHERFAYYAVGLMVGFAVTVVVPMLAGDSLIIQSVRTVFGLFGVQIVQSSDLYDKLLTIGVLIVLCIFILRVHSQWTGLVTERKFDSGRLGTETGILADALAELKARRSGEYMTLFDSDAERSEYENHVVKDQSWKSRSLGLLSALSNQYKIDPERDWIEEISSYLCFYGKADAPTLVLCATKSPSAELLKKLEEECLQQNFRPQRFVVLVEAGAKMDANFSIDSFPEAMVLFENDILAKMADFSAYSSEIIRRYETEPVANDLEIYLKDTFVELSGKIEGRKVENIESYIAKWSCEISPKQIALLGEYGQGKSTLSLKIAYDYFKNRIGERIPIIVELRGRNPRNEQIEQLLFPWCRRYGVKIEALLALMEAGRVLLILDGFDEMDMIGDAEVRFDHMRRLWEFASFPRNKLMFTGRPNFFFDTKELNWALLVRDHLEGRSYCEPLRIGHLSNEAAISAISDFPEATVAGISAVLQDDESTSSLRDLLLRPSTLIWGAAVWETLASNAARAPILSASVLRRFIQQADERQFSKGLKGSLMHSERQYFTSAVALEMFNDGDATNQITAANLDRTVSNAVEKIPDVLRDIRLSGEAPKLPIFDRFQDQQRLVQSVLTEVRASGVIVEDVSKPNTYKFAHKSFYEYLIAEVFAGSRLHRLEGKNLCGSTVKVSDTSFYSVQVSSAKLIPRLLSSWIAKSRSAPELQKFAGEILVNFAVEWITYVNGRTLDEVAKKEIAKSTRLIWLPSNLIFAMNIIAHDPYDYPRRIMPEEASRLLKTLQFLTMAIYRPMFYPLTAVSRTSYFSWKCGRKALGLDEDEFLEAMSSNSLEKD